MNYTCNDYRAEMILLGLKRRVERNDLSEEERKDMLVKIAEFEAAMKLD